MLCLDQHHDQEEAFQRLSAYIVLQALEVSHLAAA